MRVWLLAILSVVSVLLGAACAAGPAAMRDSAPTEAAPRPAPAGGSAAAPAAGRTAAAPAPAQNADAVQQNLPDLDRMIIRTVSMTIGVGDVQEAFRQVERIANEQGGLIASSQIRQDGDRTTAAVTIRVPSDVATYQLTLERLRSLADRVIEEQSQGQDVTEEYVDLESRLRNLRAAEESLLQLLSKAQRVEDILQIQRELTNVRGQIEQIQGRKQAIERRVDMATINLQIRETAAIARGGWNPSQTVAEALDALARAVRGLATVAIWIAIWTPLWGGFVLLIWLIRRLGWRPRLNLDRPRGPGTGATTAPAGPSGGSA